MFVIFSAKMKQPQPSYVPAINYIFWFNFGRISLFTSFSAFLQRPTSDSSECEYDMRCVKKVDENIGRGKYEGDNEAQKKNRIASYTRSWSILSIARLVKTLFNFADSVFSILFLIFCRTRRRPHPTEIASIARWRDDIWDCGIILRARVCVCAIATRGEKRTITWFEWNAKWEWCIDQIAFSTISASRALSRTQLRRTHE